MVKERMDLLPTSRSSIGYYYHGTNYVVHPDASFTLDQRDGVGRARDRQVGACGLALQSLPPADSARAPPIPLSSRRPLRTAQTTSPCFVSIPSLFWMP